MRTKLFYLLCVLSFIACNPTWKEYSVADIEYDANTNTWFLKSDSSVIKENFVTNDGLIDDMPFRREITVNEKGYVQTVKHYINSELILEGDFKKAPLEFENTIYPSHPTLGDPDFGLYYMSSKKTATGSTTLIKNQNRVVVREFIYDKEGKLVKEYEWENGKRVYPYSDYFSIDNVVTGYVIYRGSYEVCPAIKFKIRNETGQTITNSLRLNYKFIDKDEIIDSGAKFVSADAGWDDKMIKPVVIKSYKDVGISNFVDKKLNIKVIVSYEDGSIAYEGTLAIKSDTFD